MSKGILLNRLQAIDQPRLALFDELEALDTPRLVAKPMPDKWCILEIIEHFVLSEWDVLRGLFDPSELHGKSRTPKNRLSYFLVMFVLRLSIQCERRLQLCCQVGGCPWMSCTICTHTRQII